MPEATLADWNRFLTEYPDAHLLQSGAWGELKAAFGWQALRLVSRDQKQGMQILFRHLPMGLTFAYLPKGPVGTGGDNLLKEVDQICRERQAVFLKIEPDGWQEKAGRQVEYSLLKEDVPTTARILASPHAIQPPRTVLVDLRGSEHELLARMKQKTRYNIRLSQKKGVTVRNWQDLSGFHAMLQSTGARDGFGVHSLAYYQRAYELFHPTGQAELLLAEHEGRPLAALMVFALGRRAWYVYGASSDKERQLMPTYLLQWEAMRWAREKGAQTYDLWGVPDEELDRLEAQFTERRDGLWGVYRFKRGFGGELVRAAQAFDLVYKPLLYKLYALRVSGRTGA